MKTIYYAFVQTFEVPDDATEEEIDDLVFNRVFLENNEKPTDYTDYMWAETSDLFYVGG
jgi:hypothetical protein